MRLGVVFFGRLLAVQFQRALDAELALFDGERVEVDLELLQDVELGRELAQVLAEHLGQRESTFRSPRSMTSNFSAWKL